MLWEKLEWSFLGLCAREKREGLISPVPLERVRLAQEQQDYLEGKLSAAGLSPEGLTAVSIALAFSHAEIRAVPRRHGEMPLSWGKYAEAYGEVNGALDRIASHLARELGGVAEGATLEGRAGKVKEVKDYYPHCFSHRQVAEAAGLGYRGHHGLLVTPEFGPAVRLATVLLPAQIHAPVRELGSCGQCRDCLEACGVLGIREKEGDGDGYREACRRIINSLPLEADVCGICVRVCWDRVVGNRV